MLRSVKYGLYGAVLAGVVGGMVAWTNVDKTVTLVVDGKSRQVHTTAGDVGDVLRDAGFRVGPHDLLAPSTGASVHDGGTIVLKRGRLLRLDVDGQSRFVWTTAPTVAAALGQLGFSTTDFTSVSRAQRLPLSPTEISVRTPKAVTLIHDGRRQTVNTTDRTVGEMLSDLAVRVGPTDRLSVATSAPVRNGERVRLVRIRHTRVSKQRHIPFTTSQKDDAGLTAGTTKVVRPGRDGIRRITWALVYVDGKLAARTRVGSVVLRAPRSKLEKVGTKQVDYGSGAPNASTPSPGSAQALAKQLLAARGWGSQSQFDCLVTLWDHESGWRVNAANPSGAYGIPQALPGSKMSSAGSDWQTSAETQIKWGLGYIAERYGTPCGAWSQWQANGGWY